MIGRRVGWVCGALAMIGFGAGCGSTVSVPGAETSPCDAGSCDGALECVMDECVAPGDTDASADGPGAPPTTTDPSDTDATQTSGPEVTPDPATAVDVLLVLDDSGTMAEEQEQVAAQLSTLVDGLVGGGFDVRIATTTTDTGNYWCVGTGIGDAENGNFVLSSCLGRLSDFYFSGTDANGETACTNNCSTDTIATSPSTPWIEASSSGTNLGGGVDLQEALGCTAPQGISGCGFETPLAAMSSALRLSQDTNQDEFGFLREDAHLLVVIVSDEADCSFNPAVEDDVFGEAGVGNQVFWSLPDVQQSPTSAVCWNAGVSCDGSNCEPADFSSSGATTDNPEEAALVPVSTYLAELASLRAAKNPLGAEVFVFGILGVPESYAETGALSYAPGPNGNDPNSFQARFGIGPGCATDNTEAVPPVRLRALIESEQMSAANNIYSICSADYTPAFAGMANAVSSYAP